MKCEYCEGEGWKLNKGILERQKRCPYCGRIINMTNEEYIYTVKNTEELAEAITKCVNANCWNFTKQGVIRWLKEKYHA